MDKHKTKYLDSKETLLRVLDEIKEILVKSGTEPISGEMRTTLMDKFSLIDHRLLDQLDVASYEYYEEKLKEVN